MKNMHRPRSSRSMLGLKLDELAPFFGVSTSLLSMYELGLRDLSGHASIKASGIVACLYGQPAIITAETDMPLGQQGIFRKRHQKCLIHLNRAETKLEKMKEMEACCKNLIKVCDELFNRVIGFMPSFQLTEFEENWLKDYGRIARSRLSRCGKAHQQLLQVQIDALVHEIGLLKPLLEES